MAWFWLPFYETSNYKSYVDFFPWLWNLFELEYWTLITEKWTRQQLSGTRQKYTTKWFCFSIKCLSIFYSLFVLFLFQFIITNNFSKLPLPILSKLFEKFLIYRELIIATFKLAYFIKVKSFFSFVTVSTSRNPKSCKNAQHGQRF